MLRSSSTRARLAAATVALAVLGQASRALAEPTSSDKAMAEALFRDAKELQAGGKVAEACAKFAESHRLEPKPGTILNLAACHEEEGRTATAWADYGEAATLASRRSQAEREQFARTKVAELEKKLSYVKFRFPATSGLEVLLDGKAITAAAAGTHVPLDPGEHQLEARAAGKTPWAQKLVVEAGPSERDVAIPELQDEAAAPRGESSPSPLPPPLPAAASSSTQKTLGWAAIGVGAIGVGIGSVFGVMTLSKKTEVDAHCTGNFCDATGIAANDAAKSRAMLSTIGFVAGGVFAAGGVVLLVTAPAGKSGASTAGTLEVHGGLASVSTRLVW